MNIYRGVQVPKRFQTPQHLAYDADRFANILAAGRWHQKGVHKVEISRLITETIGEELELAGEEIEPIFNEINISFSAVKRYLETEKGERLVPHYKISSSTSQDIEKQEIPSEVLAEILEDAEEEYEEHPLYDVMEDINVDLDSVVDNLDDIDIQRTQKDEYTFNHLGEIEEYSTNYSYMFNDAEVYSQEYDDSPWDFSWVPLQFTDSSIVEARPFLLALLNEESIRSETKNLDASFQEFLFDEDMRKITELGGISRQEHTRRIIGMIGMLSTGFIDVGGSKNERNK